MTADLATREELAVAPAEIDSRLESIAVDIEMTQSVAVFRIGQRLAEARDIHKYKNGGFEAWCERRLGMTDRHARRLISVYETLGKEKSDQLVRLSRSALFQLAAPETPEPVREAVVSAVAEKVAAGGTVTAAEIKELKAKLHDRDEKLKVLKTQKSAVDGHVSQLVADLDSSSAERRRLEDRIADLQEELRRATEPGTITLPAVTDNVRDQDEDTRESFRGESDAQYVALMAAWQAAGTAARAMFLRDIGRGAAA